MFLAHPLAAAVALLAVGPDAIAHDGHGLAGSHWHASDSAGFAIVFALAALALWLSRKD